MKRATLIPAGLMCLPMVGSSRVWGEGDSEATQRGPETRGTALAIDWHSIDGGGTMFSTERQLGFIAQEVLEIMPEAVSQGSDGYYSVDYGRLTPLLVEAVKELNGTVEDLSRAAERKDAENAALADRVANLEELVAQLARGRKPGTGR